MNEKLFNLKEKLLERIGSKTYYGLINYIGRIYNGEYDAVISMARKFSNLYLALLPLAKAEYLGSIEDEHRRKREDCGKTPIIVSDRALDFILADINVKGKNTVFKKILLADDIIIHGTTMDKIRGILKDAYEKAGIDETDYKIVITAYAENMDGIALDKQSVDWEYMQKCTQSSWKEISGQIVDVLYIMGQPYTSYVPNVRIHIESDEGKKLKELISNNEIKEITDTSMLRNDGRAYALILKPDVSFKICDTYRIYEFPLRKEYVFVPMVSIKPVSKFMLEKYVSVVLDCVRSEKRDELKFILQYCQNEYKYRLVIYILSAIAGWRFWRECLKNKCISYSYDEVEEEFNFSLSFMRKADEQDELKIDEIFGRINSIYEENCKEIENVALEEKDEDAGRLCEEIDIVIQKALGEQKKISEDNIVGNFLAVNSQIDETELKEKMSQHRTGERKRMTGIPVVTLIKSMQRLESTLEDIVAAILSAVDFGKGSMVPYPFQCGNQTVYAAVLRAGEQNYKYYIDNYLPIMYAVYLLEVHLNGDCLQNNIIEIWQDYVKNLTEDKKLFAEKDKEYLMSISVRDEFEDVIVDEALYNWNNKEVRDMAAKAKNLINGEQIKWNTIINR